MSGIKFKKPRRKVERKTTVEDSDEDKSDDESLKTALEEAKELQKLRKRPNGVSIEDLATIKTKQKELSVEKDPLKLKTGGFVDIKLLKREISQVEDIDQIGTSFAVETNRRDEDADMLKYVEEELAKKKGIASVEENIDDRPKNADDALYELPDHIKVQTSRKKTEDMLSNQMLSGIPEVDLGIDTKIRNIEATEEAKQKLMAERLSRREKGVSDFVPTNVAVNFVQHNRFNIDDGSAHVRKAVQTPKPTPLRVGDADRPKTLQDEVQNTSRPSEKATDDYHYEKFKKHVRRF